MKRILPLLLLLPLAAFSQLIQSDQTDDFGKARRIATTRVEFNGLAASLGGTLVITDNDTAVHMNLFFRAGKPVALNGTSTALLRLDNGESIQVTHRGTDRQLTATEPGFFYFVLTATDRERLQTAKVVGYTIRLHGATVDVTLHDRQQLAFGKTIDLLQAQARVEPVADVYTGY